MIKHKHSIANINLKKLILVLILSIIDNPTDQEELDIEKCCRALSHLAGEHPEVEGTDLEFAVKYLSQDNLEPFSEKLQKQLINLYGDPVVSLLEFSVSDNCELDDAFQNIMTDSDKHKVSN